MPHTRGPAWRSGGGDRWEPLPQALAPARHTPASRVLPRFCPGAWLACGGDPSAEALTSGLLLREGEREPALTCDPSPDVGPEFALGAEGGVSWGAKGQALWVEEDPSRSAPWEPGSRPSLRICSFSGTQRWGTPSSTPHGPHPRTGSLQGGGWT